MPHCNNSASAGKLVQIVPFVVLFSVRISLTMEKLEGALKSWKVDREELWQQE